MISKWIFTPNRVIEAIGQCPHRAIAVSIEDRKPVQTPDAWILKYEGDVIKNEVMPQRIHIKTDANQEEAEADPQSP